MLKTILVPLDGSKLAESALDYAYQVVAPGGKLVLLSVVQVPQFPMYDFYPAPTPVTPQLDATLNDALPIARDYLHRISGKAKKDGVVVVEEVETGDPAEVITRRARELHADVIVMSTHGRSGFGRLLFGSVTQKVLASTIVPVLVVPNLQKEKDKTKELAAAPNLPSPVPGR